MTEHSRHDALARSTGSSANGIAKYEESPVDDGEALSGRLNASRAAELAALHRAEAHFRAGLAELDTAAAIDAEGVPASYRMMTGQAGDLASDAAAMRDRREWLDFDEGRTAA